MSTYSRPRLVDGSDRAYRTFLDGIRLQRGNQRASRPPRNRDLFGGEAEEALRGWLTPQLPLSEKRIVEYQERKGRNLITKYRELDALHLAPKSAQVFEIKATRKAGSIRRALKQLRETQQILELIIPQVTLTILLVDTGIPTAEDVAALLANPATSQALRDGLVPPPETLPQALETLPQIQLASGLNLRPSDPQIISLLRFGVDEIVALAGAANLHLDWSDDEDDEEPAPRPTSTTVYTSEDEPDDNPLAAALRKAMERDAEP